MNAAECSVAQAPPPTPETIRARTNLLVQAWRFAAINLRMIRKVRKGHE